MRLDLATRTLFAEFQEEAFALAALQRDLKAATTFVKKKIKGKEYWYTQRYVVGQAQQQYFGPANVTNNVRITKEREQRRQQRQLFRKLLLHQTRKAAMLRRGGLPTLDSRLAAVAACLSAARVIDGGGVLVGSIAYHTYAGVLGAILPKATLRTNDIDIVLDNTVRIALPEPIAVRELLATAGLTFHAIPPLIPDDLPASFIGPDGIRIDVLMPLRGRPRGIRPAPGLKGTGALPLHFLDYLVVDPVRAVLVGPKGGIPVMVPAPERFAVQKLIIAGRRPAADRAKREKDLAQAEQLFMLLAEENFSELRRVWREAICRGRQWEKALSTAIPLLSAGAREITSRL